MSSHLNGHSRYDLASPAHQQFQYADEYDDVDLVDISGHNPSVAGLSGSALSSSAEKTVRRRSSKACDQCRKSKCKCERSAPGEPCKSCVMLGIPCTFLGPSRKRGPPKGYIDAIEARLHQTEALLGIMLSSSDGRAKSLLRDLAKDPLAKEIINRVDNSPYGVKGRKRDSGPNSAGSKTRFSNITASSSSDRGSEKSDGPKLDLTSTHPSNEWQDRVTTMLDGIVPGSGESQSADPTITYDQDDLHQNPSPDLAVTTLRPILRVELQDSGSGPQTSISEESSSPGRRQRRRLDTDEYSYDGIELGYPHSAPTSAVPRGHHDSISPIRYASLSRASHSSLRTSRFSRHLDENRSGSRTGGSMGRRSLSPDGSEIGESEGELTGAVGQLSLNEDEQVRYHGKASGLHLLGNKERVDGRNEGGIWRFPKARVWPPLPSGSHKLHEDPDFMAQLPDPAVQERLLHLYFTHVHPSFPVIHKRAFFDAFKSNIGGETPNSPESSDAVSGAGGGDDVTARYSPFNRRRRRVPTLLLFAMFAVATRYEDFEGSSSTVTAPPPADPSTMWAAGDEYLDRAKVILDGSYSSSRPATVQALLLMGYRELGIGAMAQAWTYIGMAIRMAQDLGMHRCADRWARVGLGGRLFGDWELNERKRIWYGCIIMDKYISSYIGRPLMIYEQDFDTMMPDENDAEEHEEWTSPREARSTSPLDGKTTSPVPGRVITCFNASASLSNILGEIVANIYAVKPQVSRHAVRETLESHLDKWYIELPEHLRFDPGTRQRATLPHVLTLHMQYWCAVLLLHRPFIRQFYHSKNKNPEELEDPEVRVLAEKSHELCAGAANHITSIISLYQEKFTLSRSSMFLCYYVFTASVMHATSLCVYPDDPQARVGLSKCMEALHQMKVIWPSAGRALELLTGAKMSPKEGEITLSMSSSSQERLKRPASHLIEDTSSSYNERSLAPLGMDYSAIRQQQQQQQQQQPQHTPHASQATPHRHDPHVSYANPQDVYASSSLDNYSTYERWVPPNGSFTAPFSGPLSTSVLPQLYSTGLVDDRLSPAAGHRVSSHADQSGDGTATHSHRYPQYWNDYSTYSQLGSAYSGLHQQQQQQQQQQAAIHPTNVSPQQQQQMYMQEQYNIYS
ncbi:hypothetical protein AMATHDRAFT_195711 [Amanita thiersii Skay4041]|uniref:Zn(2)-C6 fungal-type domain-containing protein n=1 Tax=Amanita thiersii Skay4041 TaxID=703135 RepID=A0A2A9NE81_9AGAR|nr:hypothetical protein AMATHDRAFT_195711 [Amanita thiersii Skay4041]